jgi:BCD family chlorophyll transporter-like MFS transporter
MSAAAAQGLSWFTIIRLGLVQSALGSVVVLTTATLNRVMVVELALPALLPAILVGWHYAVQLSRPKWGYGSDLGQRRTPWIRGGMMVLGLGAILATDATLMMAAMPVLGVVLAVIAYAMIGLGVGAAGTSLLALLATEVAPERRPAAAAMTWILMILGIVITATTIGKMLDPFSDQRLAFVAAGVAATAIAVTWIVTWRAEPVRAAAPVGQAPAPKPPFRDALRAVWAEPLARQFTVFVFVAMLAYSAQDLILEPFAGLLFGYTVGQSTALSGVQHAGVLLGMILVGAVGTLMGHAKTGGMRRWTIAGCLGSALALAALASAAMAGPGWPLKPTVFALGFFNGMFAVAAIGSMMGLAGAGQQQREGLRMGVWGAAQAAAFGIGGLLGAGALDVLRHTLSGDGVAFASVFAGEAVLFALAAWLAFRLGRTAADDTRVPILPAELA